jgi:aminomethyltransferase
MSSLKSTPLKTEHENLGARMVDFAGWLMPVQYEGLKEEHLNVRSNVGLFDVSHMGEIRVRGPKAVETLQWTTTNDISELKLGQAHYSLFPNALGGIVDDLIVYCVKPNEDYLLCVNASNVDKDFAYLQEHNLGAEIINESEQWGQIAVQGPKAMALMGAVLGAPASQVPSFHFAEFTYKDAQVIVAHTGYTGEEGVEVFVPSSLTVSLWRELLEKGAAYGVMPIGLGARDTLRTEMKFSLYGHEIDDHTNPYSALLGWVVKPKAKDYLGKEVMLAARQQGLKQKLVGFTLLEKGIPRQGYSLFSFDNKEIGKVTSGTLSPSLNVSIGIAYIDSEFSAEGSEFSVDIRGRKTRAKVVKTPFVHTKKV